jgi:hypothetical protein
LGKFALNPSMIEEKRIEEAEKMNEGEKVSEKREEVVR